MRYTGQKLKWVKRDCHYVHVQQSDRVSANATNDPLILTYQHHLAGYFSVGAPWYGGAYDFLSCDGAWA